MNSASVRRSSGTKRIEELDFLKAVFILLMISFHLAYFGDGYPYLKKFVYTFHMPGFLIISGYLMNVNKPPRGFGKTILWLAVPYVIMETGYVLMASILPIRDHVDNLSTGVLLQKLFVNPLGPYWYLHTLILSGSLYFAVFRWMKGPELSRFMVLALSYYACSRLGIVSFACAMYFFAGIAVRRSALTFFDIFRKSWLSVAVLALMFFFPSAFDKASWGGIVIVYSVFSFVFSCLRTCSRPFASGSFVFGKELTGFVHILTYIHYML